jgi:predicted amidohydrolase YtcJ
LQATGAAPAVRIVDVGGRTIIPGFNDAHIHLTQTGAQERTVDLTGLTKEQIIERLRECAVSVPRNEPIIGNKWDFDSVPDPHKADLDSVFPDRRVILIQFSGHGAWLNSAALRSAGITKTTGDWNMGGPDRDAQGELTGIVREPGHHKRLRRLWFGSLRVRRVVAENLRSAMRLLGEHGITSVQDNTWFPWIAAELASLHERGEQTLRVSCWSLGTYPILDRWFSLKRFDPDWYPRGPRKFFADGAFSSYSAWLLEPYADRPETRGSGTESQKLAACFRAATRAGKQTATHAIGDAAVRSIVDAFESIGDQPAVRDLRHRIEHAQLAGETDIERIAKLGLLVSCQPHAAGDPAKDLRQLGEKRAAHAYPYRSLLDAGVPLSFGSDYPGESTFDPLLGIHLAVNRTPERAPAASSISPDEAITPEEALAAYTTGAAYAQFAEARKGRVAPGYLADLTVLSDDPSAVNPSTIRDIRVEATMVDGRVVYEREPMDAWAT